MHISVSDAVPALPFDIITEILSWLPVDSLLRFKCVCKKWRSLLLDYNFIAKHMVRARPLQLSYQKEWEPNKYNTILYDENFKHISGVAGLLLEESLTSRVFRIRNFATHQVLYLPDAHEKTRSVGFVFDSSTGECKAACLHWKQEGDSGYEVGFKVLSIGKDDRWRTLKLAKQNGKPFVGRYFTATQEEGAVHAVEIIRDGQDFKLEVQSLDIWSECFTITTLPRGAFLDLKRVTIFRWNYYVAVADIVEESLNVLVLEDFKEHKWRKIIVPLKFLKDNPGLKDEIRPHQVWLNDLQLHNAVKKYILVYDMERKVIKATHTKSTEKIYEFRKPSLVTLKGMKNEY
ncbi:putative F-box protein At1g50870 [Rosa rugosa]|uniref:putative F-box protein At1g50870 n=1 Tax=Rosa rugosa TaxID=74645 RepID=UPI002B402A18|nr:putative F-box protein At1g50870 [Rosa rugosa]